MRLELLRRAALLSAGVVLGLSLATATDAAQDEKKAKKGKPQQVVPTGEEDSPAAEARAASAAAAVVEANLDRMLDRSTEGLESVQHDNGMVSMDLEGRFMHVSLASKRADGTSSTSCVASHKELNNARAAARAAAKPAPPVALEEK